MGSPTHSKPGQVVLVSSMQWLYGATWNKTIVRCEQQTASERLAKRRCVSAASLRARQLELVEVLHRNAVHPAVSSYHLFVHEKPEVRRFLRQLPWYRQCAGLQLVDIGHKLPTFATYLRYIDATLIKQPVVILNQDIFLEGRQWQALRSVLTSPRQAFALSRYHKWSYSYDTDESGRALSAAVASSRDGDVARSSRLRTCKMPQVVRFNLQTTCTKRRWGAYDAYVLTLTRRLNASELNLFDFPQNTWGGENMLVYLLSAVLGLTVQNPCETLRAVHLHCELPTNLRDQTRVIGDGRTSRMAWMPKLMHKLEGINRLPYMLDYRYSTPSAPIPCEVHCIPEACPCVAVDDFARVKPKAADPANVAKWKKLQSDSRGTFGQRLRAGRRGRLHSAV